MPSTSLEKRLCRLEQRRTNASVMHIQFGGRYGDQHIGAFIVKAGGEDRLMERAQNETWSDFTARADQHATGMLKIVTFKPVNEQGESLIYDDWEYEK